MNKEEMRIWAYEKAKETLTQHGQWADAETIRAEADKLTDWLLTDEQPSELDDSLPSLEADDPTTSRSAFERLVKSRIGTEVR